MARFVVEANGKRVSVYLDCYDALGYMGEPYWEANQIEGDTCRFLLNETEEMMLAINKELCAV